MTITGLIRRSHRKINPSGTGAVQSGFDGAGNVLMGKRQWQQNRAEAALDGAALGVAFLALGMLVLWLAVGP